MASPIRHVLGLLPVGHPLDQQRTQVALCPPFQSLVPKAAVVDPGAVAALGQHLVLSISHQLASGRDLLPQFHGTFAPAVLPAAALIWMDRVVAREGSIRGAFNSIRNAVRTHQVHVRILDTTECTFRRMDRVLVRFRSGQPLSQTFRQLDQFRAGQLAGQRNLMLTVSGTVGALVAIGHAPECLGFAPGPRREVAVAGVDEILSLAVRTLSLDVAAVPASGTLLAALDAVVEACHLCITLSLCVNEKGRQDCSCRPEWSEVA